MKYYTSTEMAKELGVGTRTLADWDRQGHLVPAWRSPGGHRRYSEDQLNKIRNGDPDAFGPKEGHQHEAR